MNMNRHFSIDFQPLPYKSQSTVLAGNRKLARLTIPDATPSDAGRYECSAGTGNPSDQASIDLQVSYAL